MSTQFDHVSVIKKSNVYFGGLCISHTVQFEDGTKKNVRGYSSDRASFDV